MIEERIVCAAIHFKEENLTLPGVRHYDRVMHDLLGHFTFSMNKSSDNAEQGFLTNKGRFVNRQEARRIAIDAGQVLESNLVTVNMIFSEDLW